MFLLMIWVIEIGVVGGVVDVGLVCVVWLLNWLRFIVLRVMRVVVLVIKLR